MSVTYTALRSLQAGTAQNFWQQGGSIEIGSNLWRGLGAVADLTGTHAGAMANTNVPVSLVTTTFGPRYRLRPNKRISPYGEILIGVANGFDSLFPNANRIDTSASSFALQTGGGLDIRMGRHIAVRAIDAAWTRTQLPNSAGNVQNNLRLGAGIVFHLHN